MALKTDLMSSSAPSALAGKLGLDAFATLTALGSTQAGAAPLVSNFTNVNAGSGAGVIISQVHAIHVIVNSSGGNVTLYPPVGSSINAGSANAGFTLTTGKAAIVIPGGTTFGVIMSA